MPDVQFRIIFGLGFWWVPRRPIDTPCEDNIISSERLVGCGLDIGARNCVGGSYGDERRAANGKNTKSRGAVSAPIGIGLVFLHRAVTGCCHTALRDKWLDQGKEHG